MPSNSTSQVWVLLSRIRCSVSLFTLNIFNIAPLLILPAFLSVYDFNELSDAGIFSNSAFPLSSTVSAFSFIVRQAVYTVEPAFILPKPKPTYLPCGT